jgi:DNA-binding NarL/FixJ family response regulator
MLAARAAREGDMRITGTVSVVFPSGVSLRSIAVPRPDAGLKGKIPPAELAVIRALVEGFSYEEIAARRGTSQRTIANQIVAVFRRKAVSGRNDLVHRLFEESPLQTPTAPPAPMPVTAWAS